MADFKIEAIFDTSDLRRGAKDVKTFQESLQRETKETTKDLRKTEKQSKKTTKSVGDFFRKLAIGFIAFQGARAAINLVNDLRDLSAEMEVISQRARIVFGESFPRIQKTAVTLGARIGVTKNEFIALASATQDLLVPLGFTREQATGLTENVTILGAALAEFNNIQGGAAAGIEIVTKALLGEREQLKTLGISILESDVQFRLAIKNQEKLTGAALKQAKALATVELITESAADAVTLFGESAGKQATQIAQADAAFRQARETLALRFEPVLKLINSLFLALGNTVADFVTDLGEVKAGPIVEFLRQVTLSFASFGRVVKSAIDNIGIFALITTNILQQKFLEAATQFQVGTKFIADNAKKSAEESTAAINKFFDDLLINQAANFNARAALERNQAEVTKITFQDQIDTITRLIVESQVARSAALEKGFRERTKIRGEELGKEIALINKRKQVEIDAQEERESRFAENAALQLANVQSLEDAGRAALRIIKNEVTALIVRSILSNLLIPFPFNIAIAGTAGAIASSLFSEIGFKKGGVVPEFAGGGFVSGFTGNIPDSRPAGIVHGGELVIPATAVRNMVNGQGFNQAMAGVSGAGGDSQILQRILEVLEDRNVNIINKVEAKEFITVLERGRKDEEFDRID